MNHGKRCLTIFAIAFAATPLNAQVCETPGTLHPTLRLGSQSGDVTFAYLRAAVTDAKGNLYVAQALEEFVSVFDSSGERLANVGRAGQGPGEFGAGPNALLFRGDTLVAVERFGVHYFDRSHREVRRVTFRAVFREESSEFMAGVPLADGTFMGTRFVTPPTRLFWGKEELQLRKFDERGQVVGSVGSVGHVLPAVGDATFRRDFENHFLGHPLSWRNPWLPFAVTADGEAIVTIQSEVDDAPAFRIIKVAVDGDTIFTRSVPYDPIPIRRGDRRAIRDAFAVEFAGDPRPGLEAEQERMRSQVRGQLDLPVNYPPVRFALNGVDGSIWLLRESRPLDRDLWEIYDEEATYVGSVEVRSGRYGAQPWAPRLRIFTATRDVVWAATTDEFDVPYLTRFSVVLGCD